MGKIGWGDEQEKRDRWRQDGRMKKRDPFNNKTWKPKPHTSSKDAISSTAITKNRQTRRPPGFQSKSKPPVIKPKPKPAPIIPPPLPHFDLFASCLPGLEPFLHEELKTLGLEPTSPLPTRETPKSDNGREKKDVVGGVTFRATSANQILRCHLHLGTASNILLRCGEPFRARGMEELRRKVSKMSFWKQYLKIPPKLDEPSRDEKDIEASPLFKLKIKVTAIKSRLFHTKGIAERVQGGVETVLKEFDERCDLLVSSNTDDEDEDDDWHKPICDAPVISVQVHVHRDEFLISIDTSNTPLHRRGYRFQGAKAPLREDLAFGLLYSSGWGPRTAITAPSLMYLLDPFCGSGTIAIEGAAMSLGLPPGRLRPAPLPGSRFFNAKGWKALVKDACKDAKNLTANAETVENEKDLPAVLSQQQFVLASDRDQGAIEAATNNAKRAGVLDFINFQTCAVSANPWLENTKTAPDKLFVVTNPPFGHRISNSSSKKKIIYSPHDPLLPLYQTLGHRTSLIKGDVRVGLLAQSMDLARKTGIRGLGMRFRTHHGGLRVVALLAKRF